MTTRFTEVSLLKSRGEWRFLIREMPVTAHRKSSKHRHLTGTDGTVEKVKESFIDAFTSTEESGISSHEVYGVCETMPVKEMQQAMLRHMEGRLRHEKEAVRERLEAVKDIRHFKPLPLEGVSEQEALPYKMARMDYFNGMYCLSVLDDLFETFPYVNADYAHAGFSQGTPRLDIEKEVTRRMEAFLEEWAKEVDQVASEMVRLHVELADSAESKERKASEDVMH